jgi:hypothetical protein
LVTNVEGKGGACREQQQAEGAGCAEKGCLHVFFCGELKGVRGELKGVKGQ